MGCGCAKRAKIIRDGADKYGIPLPKKVREFLEAREVRAFLGQDVVQEQEEESQ